jgi:hypothetical protein
MKDAVAAYLALRRAAGFEMASAKYLLESFAILPPGGTKPASERKPRSNGPLTGHPPRNGTRDAKRSAGSPVTSASKMIGMS